MINRSYGARRSTEQALPVSVCVPYERVLLVLVREITWRITGKYCRFTHIYYAAKKAVAVTVVAVVVAVKP